MSSWNLIVSVYEDWGVNGNIKNKILIIILLKKTNEKKCAWEKFLKLMYFLIWNKCKN